MIMSHAKLFRELSLAEAREESQRRSLLSPSRDSFDSDLEVGKQEEGAIDDDDESGAAQLKCPKSPRVTSYLDSSHDVLLKAEQVRHSRSTKRKQRLSISQWLRCGRRGNSIVPRKSSCKTQTIIRQSLRISLKALAIALMLLGLIEFVIVVAGFVASFFPTEFDRVQSHWRSHRPDDPLSHWPTDFTAGIKPVQCHSHNDYWRPIPLRSAIRAGCTGVEADVWFLPDHAVDELYVGHSRAALAPQRTFRSLYIDPLVQILEHQNPNTTFHTALDQPRNGIFDVDPAQTLVLLLDFKTDGPELWPIVQQQLEPLRQRKYLTHFNGTAVVDGPVTVVVTGNAPFNKIVENPDYRDMFFDAPLELLEGLAPDTDEAAPPDLVGRTLYDGAEERAYLASYASLLASSIKSGLTGKGPSNQGQGHSGAAPDNPAIYTPANSYYASVSFVHSIGRPWPFLSRDQKDRIRQQILGAHRQGLKVRYWDTPEWPRGLREYIWSVLVEQGVDYLNVDDLHAATKGHWGGPRRHERWFSGNWSIW